MNETNDKNKLVKILLVISVVIASLCLIFVFLKKMADKVFVDNLFEMVAISTTEISTDELEKAEIRPVEYDSKYFSTYIKGLKIAKRGYFSKEDMMEIGVMLPAFHQFCFKLGIDTVSLTPKQRDIFILQNVRLLKGMSNEDFGTDENLWQKWQNEKDQND